MDEDAHLQSLITKFMGENPASATYNTEHDLDQIVEEKGEDEIDKSDISDDESDNEELKKEKEDEELKKEIFKNLPPHCKAFVPKEINPKKRPEPKPPQDLDPEECFTKCPKIVSREEWGADAAQRIPEQMMYRVRPSIFLETDASNCDDLFDCSQTLKTMQHLQQDLLKFDDIAYSFLISENGTIYEGRGWGYQNEKAPGFAGIGYIGFYSLEPLEGPSDAMLQSTYDLIMCGVRMGFIANPFESGAFSGETPLELIKELMTHEEDIDYRTQPDDNGIDF